MKEYWAGKQGALLCAFLWNTKPEDAGWFWAVKDGDVDMVYAVGIDEDDAVWVTGYEDHLQVKDFTHWLGPLPKPEHPKELERKSEDEQ